MVHEQGGTDLYLAPGVTWNFSGEWMVSADLLLRAYSHLSNAQLEMPVVLELGIGRLVHFEKGFDEPARSTNADVVDIVEGGELVELRPAPGKWTVFDFWAPWCEACKALDARLRALAAERPGLSIRRINIVDFNSPIARRELPQVSQLPHLRLVSGDGTNQYEASGTPDDRLGEIEKRTAIH